MHEVQTYAWFTTALDSVGLTANLWKDHGLEACAANATVTDALLAKVGKVSVAEVSTPGK